MEVLLISGELENVMREDLVKGIEPGADTIEAEAILENEL